MGTRVTLTVEHPRPEAQLARGAALIRDYENRLSANLPSSEIARINQMAGVQPVAVDPVVYRLVREAVLVSRSRAGFNAAIGPLVQLWRIGFEDAQIPERTAIDSCRELSDPDRIELDDAHSSVFLGRPGMKLDLGAIAKGWIADAIKQVWQAEGVPSGVIDLGGNVLTLGTAPHADRRWRVGVQAPFAQRGRPLGVLSLPACSVVTSGVYERSLEARGRAWHHILDPRTGYPLETGLVAVTAVSSLSTTAEIWSTIAFFNGAQATEQLVPPGLKIGFVFISGQRTVRLSSNLADAFELVDDSYRVVTPD